MIIKLIIDIEGMRNINWEVEGWECGRGIEGEKVRNIDNNKIREYS